MKGEYDYNQITPIGITDFRNIRQPFGIKVKDKQQHIYAIGKTGVGKSTLLEGMAISDIEQGRGICVLDPHGDLSHLLHYVPDNRLDDVIYFNPANTENPIAYNPLADIPPEQHHLAASNLIYTFAKVWAGSWGPRLEHTLRYCLLTLLAAGNSTLLDIQPLLTDPYFRNSLLCRISSSHLLQYWRGEFDKYTPGFRSEVISPVLNKLSLFQASDPLRNTLGHKNSSFNLVQVLNEGKVLFCNLSKGMLGEDASSLLGCMLINGLHLAAMARAKQDIIERSCFFTYIDECQSYLTGAIADMLSQSRKFGLGLFLANQYTEQLDPAIRAAIFGNCGTLIAFRIGAADAELLANEFYPVFEKSDFVNLPKYAVYLRLMIDGVSSKPFSATTLPLRPVHNSLKEQVIEVSRRKYGREAIAAQKNEYIQYEKLEEGGPASLFG